MLLFNLILSCMFAHNSSRNYWRTSGRIAAEFAAAKFVLHLHCWLTCLQLHVTTKLESVLLDVPMYLCLPSLKSPQGLNLEFAPTPAVPQQMYTDVSFSLLCVTVACLHLLSYICLCFFREEREFTCSNGSSHDGGRRRMTQSWKLRNLLTFVWRGCGYVVDLTSVSIQFQDLHRTEPWFHAHMKDGRQMAERLIYDFCTEKGARDGTFLVRPSDRFALGYTLSFW